MSLKKRMTSLLLSAVLLFSPAISFAEAQAPMSSYFAGEMTPAVIAQSFADGNQVTLHAALGVELSEQIDNAKIKAIAGLLDKSELQMSVYNDNGMLRMHMQLSVDGAHLLEADALVMEDGSVQIMSNLTGKLVLALPAGTFVDGQLDLTAVMGNAYAEMSNEAGAVRELPLLNRLQVTGNDMIALLINHLLGWVSYVQTETGDLYTFDDTYFDATQERDPVAQRMIGKIDAPSFNSLIWNIATTICDAEGDFQDTLADLLAALGVTRYQMRRFVDDLLTEETIDPQLDWVQPSYYILEANDGSLCTYDDVSYFFKKLKKSSYRVFENSTDANLGMVVSYDDFGSMVGFDADVPKYSAVLPYEGSFSYSTKSDDFWQVMHTARGELQVYNDNRVIGELQMLNGEDIDGVNESYLNGTLDVLDQKHGTSKGFGVDADLDFAVSLTEDGRDNETFEGSAVISLRENGLGREKAGVAFSGMTSADANSFETYATATAEIIGKATVVADMSIVQGDYEEIAFAGGQAMDLSQMDDAKIETIKNEILNQAVALGMKLVAHPSLLADLMTLASK